MNSQNNFVKKFSELPVKYEQRNRTDVVCIIINTVFVLLVFIVSIASLNMETLKKMTYPSDIDGKTCGWDLPQYPILYYTSFNDPTKRLCVSQCPSVNEKQPQQSFMLKCSQTNSISCGKNDNPEFEVQIYDSIMEQSRLGIFCWPKDEEKKKLLLEKSGLYHKYNFLAFYDSMWLAIGLSFAFGALYLAFIQFFPKKAIPWMVLLGGITFTILGFLLFFVASGSIFLRILIGLTTISLAALCFYTIYSPQRKKSLFICARLFQVATQVAKYNKLTMLVIPIFTFLLFCLIVLTAFQILAAWSVGNLVFYKQYPFYDVEGFLSNFLTLLIFFQFYWGLAFLKEAFNFIVSGYGVQWYCFMQYQKEEISIFQSTKLLIGRHWGSVLGGSLLISLFYFVDLFIYFFFAKQSDIQVDNTQSKNRKRQTYEKRTIMDFFNLIRSQTFGYLNLVSIPYCNGSRYCEMMSNDSGFYDFSQTTNRTYRIGAHAFLVFLVTVIALGMISGKSGQSSIYGLFFIMIISFFIVSFFVCYHGDIAEGILICIFTEEKLQGKIQTPPTIVKELYEDDANNAFDNLGVKELLIGA